MAKKQNTGGTVINQIIIKAPQRKTSDVGEWRNALTSADSGRVKRLFDLFEDLLIDSYLSDAYAKRREAVTNAEITFQDKKRQEVPDMVAIVDTIGFEDLLNLIMDVRFWGRSAMEFDFTNGISLFEIPKKHIDLINKQILKQDTDMSGIPYEGDDNLLVLGKPRDFGLFLRTAPYVIWKRGGFGDWAQWLEIFGMPQRIGKYSSFDPKSRQQLEQALENAGSAPWLVIPKESDVETVNNTGSGSSGTSFNDFRKACNEEILITVLGQTLTTIQGDKGARSLGEVHKQVEENKNRSDMRFVQRVLNQFVLPRLENRGFPVKGGRFVFPKAAEQLSVTDVVSLSKIIDIPAAYLHDKYSIPMPKEGELIAGKSAKPQPDPNAPEETPPDDQPEGKNPPKKPKLFDRFFALAPTKERGYKTNFTTRLIDSIAGRIRLSDKYSIDVNRLFNEALKEIYGGADELINKNLFEITNTALQRGINLEFAEPEFGKKNEAFINEFRQNTAVFAAFKNHQQTQEIVDLLTDEDGNLRSFSQFKKLALQISKDYNVNWLQTEYNTAVRAARSAVNYRKYLETEKLYPNLEYMQTTAAHPRASHLEYVGTILPIRHPWWDTHMPPSDWNCACSVRPTDADVTSVPGEEFVSPVFSNNPGKTAEFVNLDEHPYIKGVCPYFATCRRRTGQIPFRLADNNSDENPPIIPQCRICELATAYAQNLKRIEENKKRYNAFGSEWKKEFFVVENGGYLVINKQRIKHSLMNKQEKTKFRKELKMAQVFAKSGFAVEMLEEVSRIPSPDALINGILADLKKTKSHNNIINYAKNDVKNKKAKIFFYEFEKENKNIYLELQYMYKKYRIKAYFYFTGKEDVIYQNF
jgi:phage gp29-like protein